MSTSRKKETPQLAIWKRVDVAATLTRGMAL